MKKKSELMKMVAIISFTSLVTNVVACGSSLSLSDTSNEESSGTEGEDSRQDGNSGAPGQQRIIVKIRLLIQIVKMKYQ